MKQISLPLSLLVADDSIVVRRRLVEMLADIPGVEVVAQAASGEETLELIRRLQPDVLTLDLSMPDGNGLEVLKQIHDENLRAVVIVLTNFAHPGYEARAKQHGAHAFLSKSHEFGKLTDLIRDLVDKRRQPSGTEC